jgi:predicted ATPase/DNA-binding SARP family transcriptional activator
MSHLSLALLGVFQINLDGAPVTTFDSNKVRALLAYLAVEADRPHRRETLAGLLWPDTPEPSARRSLSQALFNLRQAIGDSQAEPPFLLISRDTIQFNPASNYTLDVAVFKELLTACEQHAHPKLEQCDDCAPRLQQAIEQYRGDFLPGFFLEDSAAFEEWTLLQRENLHRRALTAMAHLADYYEQQGDYAAAIQVCSRQLALDAWREEAHRQMMRVLALSGQRSAALAQYENCRRLLAAELGVEPAAETKALYEEIKAGELSGKGVKVERRGGERPPAPLPVPLTPFVGRERELADLSRLLADPACRLLTLVGPGGIGKTRLALQVAASRQQAFAYGAVFVSLSSVPGGELISQAIADAVGFTFYGPTDLQGQLLNYLREKELLLVLDNFEQLLAPLPQGVQGDPTAVHLLREILQYAPGIKLLVTSREQLNIQGEWVFEIEGLGRHAVDLFKQSARRARAGFEIGEDDYPVVERICRLAGGMPLAIELAAAWVRLLPYAEIAREIERNLDFLETFAQDVPERHRSIRAAFDHSWKLLSTEERRALQSLSVFRGGFRREAAEVIGSVSLRLLSALVGKSLVHPDDAHVGRYELHDLIRQYAAAKLAGDPGERAAVHDRHCSYYAAWLESREAALTSAYQPVIVTEINAEIDNIRTAWAWAVMQAKIREINQAGSALFWYYELRNWFQEGVALFGNAAQSLFGLNKAETAPALIAQGAALEQHLALAQVLTYQGFFSLRHSQHHQAKDLLRQSLKLLRPLEAGESSAVQPILSYMLAFLGIVMYRTGDYVEGRRLLQESLMMKRALGDRWGMALCLRQLGLATLAQGEYTEAHRLLSESLALSRQMGNRWSMAFSLNFLSRAAYAQGAYSEARQLLQEGLALSQALEDRYNIATALTGLGLVSQALGSALEAQGFFQESIVIWREIGDQAARAQTLNHLGHTLLALGNRPEARRCFWEALALARHAQAMPVALAAVLGLAAWQVQEGVVEPALELSLYILQHPAAGHETKDQAEKLRIELEARLAPAQVAAIRAQLPDKNLELIVSAFQ